MVPMSDIISGLDAQPQETSISSSNSQNFFQPNQTNLRWCESTLKAGFAHLIFGISLFLRFRNNHRGSLRIREGSIITRQRIEASFWSCWSEHSVMVRNHQFAGMDKPKIFVQNRQEHLHGCFKKVWWRTMSIWTASTLHLMGSNHVAKLSPWVVVSGHARSLAIQLSLEMGMQLLKTYRTMLLDVRWQVIMYYFPILVMSGNWEHAIDSMEKYLRNSRGFHHTRDGDKDLMLITTLWIKVTVSIEV